METSNKFAIQTTRGQYTLELVAVDSIPRGKVGSLMQSLPPTFNFSIQISVDDVHDHECTEGDALVRNIVFAAVHQMPPVSEAEQIKLFDRIHNWLCERRATDSIRDHEAD